MSYSFDGANDRLTGTFTSTYAQPVSIALWMKVTTHPVAGQVLGQFGNSNSSNNDSVSVRTGGTDDQYVGRSTDSAGIETSAARVQTGFDGIWVPIVGVFTSDTDRKIYVNSSANVDPNGVSRVVAGVLQFVKFGEALSGALDYAGLIAEPAIWRKSLNTTEIDSYCAGNTAGAIGASDLIGYWRLNENGVLTNEGIDSGGDLTATGAVFDADHPTITGFAVPSLIVNRSNIRFS